MYFSNQQIKRIFEGISLERDMKTFNTFVNEFLSDGQRFPTEQFISFTSASWENKSSTSDGLSIGSPRAKLIRLWQETK